MKNRITALLLVLMMAATLLCGCTYKFDKKNLDKYVEAYDAQALYNALTSIVVEDEDFTDNQETRDAKTAEAILNDYVAAFGVYFNEFPNYDTVTSGALTGKDGLLLRWVLVTADGEILTPGALDKNTLVTFADAVTFQAQIYKALKEKITDETVYGEWITGDSEERFVEEGDKVLVQYDVKTVTGETSEVKEAVVEWLDITAGATLAGNLIDKKVGKLFATGSGEDAKLKIGTDTDYKEYSNVTPYIVANNALTCELTAEDAYTLYDKNKTGAEAKIAKDDKVTVYAVPTGRIEFPVPTKDAEDHAMAIKALLLAFNFSENTLGIFSNEEYKYEYQVTETVDEKETAVDKTLTLKEIFAYLTDSKNSGTERTNYAVVKAALDYDLLKAEKDAADKALKDYEDYYETNKDSEDETVIAEIDNRKALSDAAEKAYSDEETWIIKLVTMILSSEKTNEDTTTETAGEAIFDSYYEFQFDSLESAYETAIYEKVSEQVEKILADNIKVTKAPKSAVREAYYNNLDAYRYDYYEGSTYDEDGNTVYNVDQYKTVELYLQAKATEYLQGKDENAAAVTTRKARKEALRAEAEEQVKDLINLYTTAKALNAGFANANLEVTKEDELDFIANYRVIYGYWSYLTYYQMLYNQQGYDVTSMTAESIYDTIVSELGETNFKAMVLSCKLQDFLYANDEADDSSIDFTNIKYTTTAKAN